MRSPNTVILIDDDHDDHEIFSLALREADPYVNCFYLDSAQSALALFADEKKISPDYIFLDLNMPGMNGLQFLEWLKNEGKISLIPVIVFSTSILPSEKAKVLELGASRFYIKPSSLPELIQILKEIFEH